MIDKKQIRLGNVYKHHKKIKIFDESCIQILFGSRNYQNYFPIFLTKEILKENFDFSIYDMGDFWQCQKEDFMIIQPKFSILGLESHFILYAKTSVDKPIIIHFAHTLQNLFMAFTENQLEYII